MYSYSSIFILSYDVRKCSSQIAGDERSANEVEDGTVTAFFNLSQKENT